MVTDNSGMMIVIRKR